MTRLATRKSGFAKVLVALAACFALPHLAFAQQPATPQGATAQQAPTRLVAAEQSDAGAITLLSLAEEVSKPEQPGGDSDDQETQKQVALPAPLRPMAALGVDIGLPAGKLPRDFATERGAEEAPPAGLALVRGWPLLEYHWAASGSRSFPLYFEEVNAERYGYTCSYTFQPVISAAHFFGTIPYLPYLMAADCPRECTYTLGHYRPGNCNPWRPHCFPIDCKAAGAQGAAVAGLIFLLP